MFDIFKKIILIFFSFAFKMLIISFYYLGGFHPKDIERIKSTNIWLQRFLEQHDLNMKAALDMLWETCEWRKTYGANGNLSLPKQRSLIA